MMFWVSFTATTTIVVVSAFWNAYYNNELDKVARFSRKREKWMAQEWERKDLEVMNLQEELRKAKLRNHE